MLDTLRLANLALLESAELALAPGFTVVSGETGAGKSVLLGALALLSGARAEKTLIRQGAEACTVEASFRFAEPARLNARLEELGLPPCGDEGELVLRRVLSRTKAPRIVINGALAPLASLQEVGKLWIDFHGPGEPQKLFYESEQLALLDAFAQNGPALAEYQAAWRQWRATVKATEELRTAERLSPDEIDFLTAQLEKLDRACPTPEGLVELERDYARLSRAQELLTQAGALEVGLAGDEGVTRTLAQLLGAARTLARFDPPSAPLAQRLESLIIEAEDLAAECSQLRAAYDFDPATAEALENRMSGWLDLKRQYGGDLAAIRRRRDELARKLASQGDIEGQLAALEATAARQQAVAAALATTLRERRTTAAARLGAEAAQRLLALGFKKARLRLDLPPTPGLTADGDCTASFLFAPNAGQELLPLRAIASSGELARVMLALKTTLATVDATPVLVFDEVDANVGGEVAVAVGRALAGLGAAHQVLCVTHLPQVAALAPHHLVVRKEQTDDTTRVSIAPLDGDRPARLGELARMLGDRHSPAALRHAEELLGG